MLINCVYMLVNELSIPYIVLNLNIILNFIIILITLMTKNTIGNDFDSNKIN